MTKVVTSALPLETLQRDNVVIIATTLEEVKGSFHVSLVEVSGNKFLMVCHRQVHRDTWFVTDKYTGTHVWNTIN